MKLVFSRIVALSPVVINSQTNRTPSQPASSLFAHNMRIGVSYCFTLDDSDDHQQRKFTKVRALSPSVLTVVFLFLRVQIKQQLTRNAATE